MDTNKIKDIKSNTQTQTRKEEQPMTDKEKAKLKANYKGVLFDISKQIKFNNQYRFMKLSYLDTRLQDHKAIADRVIKNLSEDEKQILREYKNIIDKVAIQIGNDIKAQWKLTKSHQKVSKVITTPQVKPAAATVTKVFKYNGKTITVENSIVTSIMDANGKRLTKAKVEDSWILVGREVIKK